MRSRASKNSSRSAVQRAGPAADSATVSALGRPTHKAIAAFALPAPVLGITAPMSGEPAASDLEQARLVSTTCEKISTEEADRALNEMRAAVAAAFDRWVKEQPACWAA